MSGCQQILAIFPAPLRTVNAGFPARGSSICQNVACLQLWDSGEDGARQLRARRAGAGLHERRPAHRARLAHHSDSGSQGGFIRSSQHPDNGGCDDGSTRFISVHTKEVALPPAARRHGSVRIVAVFGKLSPRDARARKLQGMLACRRPLVRAGFGVQAECHQRTWRCLQTCHRAAI